MTKTLHLFNPVVDFASVDAKSTLLNNANTEIIADQYHTSLGDLSAEEIISISKHFDVINFVQDQFDVNSDLYRETVILLQFLSHRCCVTNFHNARTTALTDSRYNLTRPNDEPILWVFGCSHSAGVGLKTNQKSFGTVLGESLGVHTKIIAQGGSSTHWSFRHIIGADIQQQDIVIWQLTTPERLTQFHSRRSTEVQLRNTPKLLQAYSDDQVFFNQISMLHAGVAYLRSKKCKFAITSILSGTNQYRFNYLHEYIAYPEYCYSPDFVVDFGTDGLHSGPLSHQRLADSLLNHVQLLYE